MINPITTTSNPLVGNETKKYSENIRSKEAKEVDDKVSQIKESIKNGTYQVDIHKTSEKMALNLLNL